MKKLRERPRWSSFMFWVCIILVCLHLFTTFVYPGPDKLNQIIAYTTAIIHPLTIGLFWFTAGIKRRNSDRFKLIFCLLSIVYISLYGIHLNLLHEPEGGGRISGYALFALDMFLIFLFYLKAVPYFAGLPLNGKETKIMSVIYHNKQQGVLTNKEDLENEIKKRTNFSLNSIHKTIQDLKNRGYLEIYEIGGSLKYTLTPYGKLFLEELYGSFLLNR